MAAPAHKSWEFGQCFGEKDNDEEFSEADVLSAVRFDETGDYLATGDKGGRIVIFERAEKGRRRPPACSRFLEEADAGGEGGAAGGPGRGDGAAGGAGLSTSLQPLFSRVSKAGLGRRDGDADGGAAGIGGAGAGMAGVSASPEYRFLSEFQSHEAEFDYLKSLEIEEKINQIAWCRRVNANLFLLSTNDKTIKLWKVGEKRAKAVADFNVTTGRFGGALAPAELKVPRVVPGEPQMVAMPRRVYSNAHAYHINSIAANSDGETFLSADDLRINLWALENGKLSFNIVDIKPPSLEELTEVITAAEFHPQHCHTFVYASSRGTVKLGDMRASALCDRHAKSFEEPEDPAGKSYFSEIIASVSDLEFTRDGRYIVSRDYLSIKVWDVAMEARPLKVIPVHEFLRPRLVELYESDCIFDKFEVSTAGRDGSSVMTGSYSNSFKIYDTLLGSETTVELAKGRPKPPAVRPVLGGVGLPPPPGEEYAAGGAAGGLAHGHGHRPPFDPLPPINPEAVDFSRKVLHFSWHPCEDIMAVAGLNNLYIYHAGGAGAGGMGGGGAAGGAGVGVGVGSAGHEP